MTDLPATTLLADLRELIEGARQRAAVAVNSELVLLYWNVGTRIRSDILKEERAEYGKEIVATLSRQLAADFGRGFTPRNLHYMVRFAEVFADEQIVHALRAQLTWTHLRELIYIDDPLKRQFYTEMCRIERWSTRTLKAKINGMLFERTAIAKRPEVVITRDLDSLRDSDRLTPDFVFRDPYLLDFLGLAPERPLRALVAIELKLGRFDARDMGQMALYLRWLDEHERQPDENQPLGLILCADRNQKQVELMKLDDGNLRVASYLTALPPKALLERKLLDSIRLARARAGTVSLPEGDNGPGEEDGPS